VLISIKAIFVPCTVKDKGDVRTLYLLNICRAIEIDFEISYFEISYFEIDICGIPWKVSSE
jgi:hypothetical protein